jgi:hypothetical protein
MKRSNHIYILACTCLLVLFSCKHGEGDYHGIIEKVNAEGKNYHGTSISSKEYLEGMEMIEITEGKHTFLIPDRKGKIRSYACTECHSKPLDKMQSKDLKKAHWDIKLVHANENTMNCVTCHNPNNMDQLNSLTGKDIDFNNSYNLCNQCHSKQFEDWKGGAHGKRLGGWAPPRAAMTCVNCHNPHKPHFESRWPSRFNTQTEKERK